MSMRAIYAIAFICLVTPQALADVYKCILEDGAVKFSDEPCSNDAQVEFETDSSKTFDELIGDGGYPYPEMPLAPNLIKTEDIVEHAKKIASRILPGEYINSAKPMFHDTSHRLSFNSKVIVYFGPEDTDTNRILMEYHHRHAKDEGYYVFLRRITIIKERRFFDPPSLSNVRTFTRRKKGIWTNNIEHNF